jgi:hypothetical protein
MITQQRYDELMRATARAKAALKPGDRIVFTSCPGTKRWATVTGWDGNWICTATRSDISAGSISRVNGEHVTFNDTIEIGGRSYRRFIRHPDEVDDGTVRCIQCGQIDELEWHDGQPCRDALIERVPTPRPELSPPF